MHSYYEPLQPGQPYGITYFCSSFSTLSRFVVEMCSDWTSEFNVDMLKPHTKLEECVLGLGESSMNISTIATIRNTHKAMRVLGYRCNAIASSLHAGFVTMETDKRIRDLTTHMVQFEKLEEWQLICTPISGITPTYAACETFALDVYQGYTKATVASSSAIKVITIIARDAYYTEKDIDAGRVSGAQRIVFESTTA
jgi:hypothetical protein